MKFLNEFNRRTRQGMSSKHMRRYAAEDGAGGGTGGENANEEGNATQTGAAETKKTFDDILSDKEYQSEFDRRVAKALETAKTKWDEGFEKALGEKIAEANKLAKMSADEKAKFEREKQEEDYKKRLAEVTKRELKAEAREQLVRDGLPAELAETLIYTDADSCKASMDAVKSAFNAAVEKAIDSKLKGGIPKDGAQAPDYDNMSDEEYYKTILKKQE